MIHFEFQTASDVKPSLSHKQWLKAIIRNEGLVPGEIDYLFCDDAYLLDRNLQFLQHDTYTDIITFDDCQGDIVSGTIMISLDRVGENAQKFGTSFERELLRVMAHGVLHLCGYKDKSESEAAEMRRKEDESLRLWDRMNL